MTDLGVSTGLEIYESLESEVRSYIRAFPTVFATASGSVLTDVDGRDYIDFFAGAGTLNYGHDNPVFRQAIIDYMTSGGVTHGLDFATVAKSRFLATFDEVILQPRGLHYKFQFTGPTGANAVEAALKVARQATGRSTVVSFTQGYHGLSGDALAATGNRKYRTAAGHSLDNVVFMPYDGYFSPDFDTLGYFEHVLDDPGSGLDHPAAVIVETIQGEGGVNVASASWLQRLRALCDRYEMLLIVDDIQVGCGRTGEFFSFEDSGIVPDVVVLSKSLSGYGLPFSLVLMKPEHDVWAPGGHTGTFRGNNLAFVGATAALDTYWRDDAFALDTARKATIASDRLAAIAARYPDAELTTRGRGLIQALATSIAPGLPDAISEEAFTRGLVIETAGARGRALKLIPSLTIDDATLERGLDIVEESVAAALAR